MKSLVFLILTLVLAASITGWQGAEISTNELGVALMLLLLALFGDLKDFDFWGLKGTRREEAELRQLKGDKAIAGKNIPKISPKTIQTAQQQTDVTQLIEDPENFDEAVGAFLTLTYELERQLRITAQVMTDNPETHISPERLPGFLKERGFLTESGARQLRLLFSIRDRIIQQASSEMPRSTIELGLEVAQDFYEDLKQWQAKPNYFRSVK